MDDTLTFKIREDECFSRYSFCNICYFDVVRFNGIDDYNNYLDDDYDSLFNSLYPIHKLTKRVDGFDWGKENNEKVNVFELFRNIEAIGMDYVSRYNPDVIFYEASNLKLHRIYQRLFPKNYTFYKKVGISYIYLRNDLYHILKSKDNKMENIHDIYQ